jgi:hypothetical protein
MASSASICRDWIEHLASSRQDGSDPRARARGVIDECRPAMDKSDTASLRAELESRLSALRSSIVPLDRMSAHDWQVAVIEGAVEALKSAEALDKTPRRAGRGDSG